MRRRSAKESDDEDDGDEDDVAGDDAPAPAADHDDDDDCQPASCSMLKRFPLSTNSITKAADPSLGSKSVHTPISKTMRG